MKDRRLTRNQTFSVYRYKIYLQHNLEPLQVLDRTGNTIFRSFYFSNRTFLS